MIKVFLLSLGCPRNLTDSEVLLGKLEAKNFTVTSNVLEADVAIVNTCGFIDEAKQESIDHILELVELKKTGKIKKIIVSGCLPQRYPKELLDEIEEIDGVFGSSDFIKIPELIESLLEGNKIREVAHTPEYLYDHLTERHLVASPHSVYIKIQEGCSNRCSYCVIPELKGPRRSRKASSVLEEVKNLKEKYDLKEAVLIGQDTTSFGMDRDSSGELERLLRKTSKIMEGGWVRLLYTHPAHFTKELIETISREENVCKYVDLPIQHINDAILKRMNRRATRSDVENLIKEIREKIENVIIRTSIIVGFPGEGEEEFQELLDFLEETRFDRLGAFTYSQEEGTPAAGYPNQVLEEVKKERFDRVMKLQRRVSHENNQKLLGKELKVLIDEKDSSSPDQFVGRSQMDAPEVDGVIYVKGKNLKAGDFTCVKITGTLEYDLIGETL